jgi:hypothetical protein
MGGKHLDRYMLCFRSTLSHLFRVRVDFMSDSSYTGPTASPDKGSIKRHRPCCQLPRRSGTHHGPEPGSITHPRMHLTDAPHLARSGGFFGDP